MYPAAEGSSPGRHKFLFINGAKKAWAIVLLYRYNISPASELRFDRDHQCTVEFSDFTRALADAVMSVPAAAREATISALRPPKRTCEFSHADLRKVFFPEEELKRAPDVMATGGSGASSNSNVPRATPLATPVGVVSVPQITPVVVLLDFDNAPNALPTFSAGASRAAPTLCASSAAGGTPWRVVAFKGKGGVGPLPVQSGNLSIEVDSALTDCAEAADTGLCFGAAELHAREHPATVFIVVCASEGRYGELVAKLKARGREARLLRFDNAAAAPDAFIDELVAEVISACRRVQTSASPLA